MRREISSVDLIICRDGRSRGTGKIRGVDDEGCGINDANNMR